MTPEEWAKDTMVVLLNSASPTEVLTALVEKIHVETVLECAEQWRKNKQQTKPEVQWCR